MTNDTVKHIEGPTILLHSGAYLDFARPEACNFTLLDVVHALSNICRFGGHSRFFYSVAEHSLLVSRLVTNDCAWAGLMHDAAEAFIGDVVKPLKVLLPDYAAVEDRVERAVFARFEVPLVLPLAVKVADRQALFIEQRKVMGNNDEWTETEKATLPAGVPAPFGLSPAAARTAFMDRAAELRPWLVERT
jgi:hypothetical protein